ISMDAPKTKSCFVIIFAPASLSVLRVGDFLHPVDVWALFLSRPLLDDFLDDGRRGERIRPAGVEGEMTEHLAGLLPGQPVGYLGGASRRGRAQDLDR